MCVQNAAIQNFYYYQENPSILRNSLRSVDKCCKVAAQVALNVLGSPYASQNAGLQWLSVKHDYSTSTYHPVEHGSGARLVPGCVGHVQVREDKCMCGGHVVL